MKIINHNYLKSLSYLLFLLILLSPLFDYISVYSRYYGIDAGARFSLFFRAIIIVTLVILCSADKDNSKPVLWCFFAAGIFTHLIIIIINEGDNYSVFLDGVLLLVKYHLFFLYLGAFLFSIKLGVRYEKLLLCMYLIIGVYSISIMFGALFNIDMFKYYSTARYGIKGIIIAGNEVSGFLTAALGLLLVNDRNNLNKGLLVFVCIAMVLCGTKAALLGLFMIMSAYLLSKWGARGFVRLLGLSFILILVGLWLYQSNLAVYEAVSKSMAYFEYQFENNANGSWLTLLLSGRDNKLEAVYSGMIDTSVFSFLIGGYPISEYMVEMDFFDYLALNGFLGVICYFYYWFMAWGGLRKGSDKNFTMAFIIAFFILGFFGGHIFSSAVAAPVLAFMIISLRNKEA